MSDNRPMAKERALVLGGGGSAGNAWLIGVVAGLAEAGVDVADADLVVGTSAGATAAAQLGGTDAAALLADIATAVVPPRRPPSAGPVVDHLERTGRIIAAASDPADMRRRLGEAALELDDDGSWSARWREIVAGRLPSSSWASRRTLVTAVDARTGAPVVLDRDSGYRRNENADLAAGHDRVLVLSPLGGRTRTPLAWGQHLAAQVEELRAAGSRVVTVLPDAASLAAFGSNLMDPATRPPAARAGREQGLAVADEVGDLWR